MDLNKYIDEPMLVTLRRLLPSAAFQLILTPSSVSEEPSVSIELPVPAEAEYGFRLYLQPERQIHARLLAADVKDYFWYMAFEDAAFRNSVEDLDAAFVETVERLIRNETRIVQKRGLIADLFKCDYKAASGWKRVYSHSAFRFGGFHPPLIAGRERIYTSPAVAP
jgi:hypothetical protein